MAATPQTPQPADPLVGATVDQYKVRRVLGKGGMGTVYEAEHVLIRKRIALKVLDPDLARKPELIARFLQEAQAASKIDHENIVDISNFGETPNGSAFIAMEFLDGKDLAGRLVESGALPLESVFYIAGQVCRALGAAHEKGVIHRDLKPENIFLITRGGRGDFVKVLDFGIAKVAAPDTEQRLTREGALLGTPEYMSPEQAKGEDIDHRSDIYAVGCILYEMLAGVVPFRGQNYMSTLTKHMFEPPDPLSNRVPNKNIPPALVEIVMKALAKDRDQRFSTMQEMAEALEACERTLTSGAAVPSPAPPVTATIPTPTPVPLTASMIVSPAHGRRWLVVVAALILIGGGAAIIGWQRLTSTVAAPQEKKVQTVTVPDAVLIPKAAEPPRRMMAPVVVITPPPDLATHLPEMSPPSEAKIEEKPVPKIKAPPMVVPATEVRRSLLPKLPTPPPVAEPEEKATPQAAVPPPAAKPEPPPKKEKKGLLDGVLDDPFGEKQEPPK